MFVYPIYLLKYTIQFLNYILIFYVLSYVFGIIFICNDLVIDTSIRSCEGLLEFNH